MLKGQAEKSNPLYTIVPASRFTPTRDLYHFSRCWKGLHAAEVAVFFWLVGDINT